MVPDELEKLLAEARANFECRSRQHVPVFGKNRISNVEPGRFGNREQEERTLQPVWFQGGRDKDIGVDYKPKRNHPRLRFSARTALITLLIRREESLSVPLRRDSSPMIFNTSGSGAARRT